MPRTEERVRSVEACIAVVTGLLEKQEERLERAGAGRFGQPWINRQSPGDGWLGERIAKPLMTSGSPDRRAPVAKDGPNVRTFGVLHGDGAKPHSP